jgi:SAM-dependent methyltransferase
MGEISELMTGDIAEIGPGFGDFSSWIISRWNPRSVELFEISSSARKILQKRFLDNPNVLVNGEFTRIGQQFDILLCFEALEHIEADWFFLNDIHDRIKKGGYFIGSVPAYMNKWQYVDEVAGHFRRYEYRELELKIRDSGFNNVTIYPYGFPVTNFFYPLRQLFYKKAFSKAISLNKKERTERSGISRGFVRAFNVRLIYSLLRLMEPFQRIPVFERLGDGFLFIGW